MTYILNPRNGKVDLLFSLLAVILLSEKDLLSKKNTSVQLFILTDLEYI